MGYGDDIMRTVATDWYVIGRTRERWLFNPAFRVRPGRIDVAPDLLRWAEPIASGRILVEPHIKGTASGDNKDWGWESWQALARRSPLPLLQCAPKGKATLDGIDSVTTPTFEHAVACLAMSRGIVTTEGGLHHAAGALRKPAVVIFGAFNSPKLFGYDFHENLDSPDPECLGRRQSHPACRRAMQRITVDDVLAAMGRMWPEKEPLHG